MVAGVFAACDPNALDVAKSYSDSEIVPPAMKSMPSVNVSQANYDANGLVTFSWDAADFGMPSALNYSLYMSSDNRKDMQLASNIFSSKYEIDYQSLYNRLIGESYLGLAKGRKHTVACYVTATMGDNFTVVKSQPVNVDFEIARISTGINMLYVTGDFNNNHPDRDGMEEDKDGSKTYRGLINMKNPSISTNNFKFVEYTYAGTTEGNLYGDEGGVVAVGGSALQATPELTWFKVDLNTGKYQMATLGGAIRLCGFNGSWSFKNNPELVYDATENAWIGVAEYSTSNFRISINDSWSYTFGPKRIEDLVLKDGADIKIYHNDIGKPIVGGDTNFKMASPGKYRFKFYYESADCTWHLSVNVAS